MEIEPGTSRRPLPSKDALKVINWTTDTTNDLCTVLCDVCLLTNPLVNDELVLQTDASGHQISVVLSVYRNVVEKPVAFYSRQLKDAEKCYAATELECLAVVESVRHFEVYFLVQTP